MRVDAVNQISQIYKPSGTKKFSKQDSVSHRDAYEISQSAKDYQIAKNAVAQAPDVREAKIADLKEALASGSYNVSAQEVAEKIVSRYFDYTV